MAIPLPDLGENYQDFRVDRVAFGRALRDVATVFLDLGRAELHRATQEGRPPSCKRLGIGTATRNLVQAPADWDSRKGYYFGAQWLSPGCVDAIKSGTLAEANVTREHPFVRHKTRDLVFELVFGGAKQSDDELLVEIEKLLDSRLPVVCHVEWEIESKGGWILSERRGDGWQRYARCPGEGLWDRSRRCWCRPWLDG